MDYYQEQMGEIVSTAKYGDLIQFEYPMGYSHWGVFEEDGHVLHFAVADETRLMSDARKLLQSAVSVCGDLLLGMTKIRRMPLSVVTVPTGARVLISNSFHAFEPSSKEAMENRLTGLLNVEFPYDLFSFNCEHFATFVRYGKAVCNQLPGRSKDKECEKATELFQDTIASKRISQDLFKL